MELDTDKKKCKSEKTTIEKLMKYVTVKIILRPLTFGKFNQCLLMQTKGFVIPRADY